MDLESRLGFERAAVALAAALGELDRAMRSEHPLSAGILRAHANRRRVSN
jgi:hypothetical protein